MKRVINLATFLIFCLFGQQIIFAQDDCNYSSKGNNMVPDKLCAPVTAEWSVSYGGVTYAGPGPIQIYFDWDDGTAPSIVNATFNGLQWVASQTHVYPTGGDKCNYRPSTMLVVNGTLCTSSIQTQIVTVWDVDDQNGGILNVSPAVFPICLGDDGSTYFYDASQWNCVPPVEYDTRNNTRRWIQWIYGTGGTTISTARVGNIVRSYPYTGDIEATDQPIESPQAPMNQSMLVYIPDNYNVGDYFEVTLRNWNYCNPYDDPNIPGTPVDEENGDNDPVEITAIALIVALPDGTVTAVGPFCENDPAVNLSAVTPGGTWTGSGITDPVAGLFDPSVAGAGFHTINYDVTDPNGCSASGSTQIEVWDSPDITLSVSNPTYLCPGIIQSITSTVTNGTPPYDIEWLGDTSPLSSTDILNPVFNTTTTGIYNLQFMATDNRGCTSTELLSIEVSPVSVEFNPPLLEVCQYSTVTLEPLASGGSQNYILHEWSGPNISKLSATNISTPGLNTDEPGIFVFNYRVTDDQGCSDESTITVTIKEQPIANAGPDATTCYLYYTLEGNQIPSATAEWSLISGPGNASFSTPSAGNATVTVDQTGVYIFNWKIDLDGCINNDEVEITFSELPTPEVVADFAICGFTAEIEAIPDIPGGVWLLTSGPGNAIFDDAAQAITNVEVDQPGIYTFTWREASGYGCDAEALLQVTFMPQAEAIVDPLPSIGCTPYEVTFPNSSVNADSYIWDLGGGLISTEENPVHTFENYTSSIRAIEISLQATNSYGCNDTFSFNLEIAPKPNAFAIASPPAGCAPLTTTFINNSEGATLYQWDFKDGSPINSQFEPTHTFTNETNFIMAFPVKLYVENSFTCIDSITTYVTVYPSSPLPLTITPDKGCHPLTVTLSANPGFITYNWNYGDGTVETGGFQTTHEYNNTTYNNVNYNITLVASNPFNCVSTATGEVTIFPSPVAAFNATPTELQMPDRTVSITNETAGTNWSYLWDFGDGSTSSQQHPGTHVYQGSGTYTIQLTVTYGQCSDVETQDIVIRPMMPEINYGATPSEGCPPLSVTFTNSTLDATAYLWEFGDGMMSQEVTPSHTYQVPGTYKVRLTATGPGGSSISDNLEIIVYEKPYALFDVIPKVIFVPGEKPVLINYSVGATRYEWDFGDETTSTDFSPSHQYLEPGVYTISLWVANNQGCEDRYTLTEAIKAEQGGTLKFPNAFTPNPSGPSDGRYTYGDPRNFIFYPFTQEGIVEYQLQIFNRWGELVFESHDVEVGWDGYHKKKLVPQGVYIWRVRYKTSNGKVEIKSGDVTLIR